VGQGGQGPRDRSSPAGYQDDDDDDAVILFDGLHQTGKWDKARERLERACGRFPGEVLENLKKQVEGR
jgi:hypothetical protein